MVIYCLECKTKLRLTDEAIGRKVRCRHCGAKFVVDEAYLKDEARFRHAERERKRRRDKFAEQFLNPIGKIAGQIRSAVGMILLLPFYAVWGIVRYILEGSKPNLEDVTGRSMDLNSGVSMGYDSYHEDDDEFQDEIDDDSFEGAATSEPREKSSRFRNYWDSKGRYVGYRDDMGWFHEEGGKSFAGYVDDDGVFYDSSGMRLGQIEESGYIWVDGKGYVGFKDGNTYSREGHYGIPDIYEEP